jgi:hypothetical protein
MMTSDKAAIVREIASTYAALSPENLYRDGEASPAHAKREGARLKKRLSELFKQYGRPVGEIEAYDLVRAAR